MGPQRKEEEGTQLRFRPQARGHPQVSTLGWSSTSLRKHSKFHVLQFSREHTLTNLILAVICPTPDVANLLMPSFYVMHRFAKNKIILTHYSIPHSCSAKLQF